MKRIILANTFFIYLVTHIDRIIEWWEESLNSDDQQFYQY